MVERHIMGKKYKCHRLVYTHDDGIRTVFRAGEVPGLLCEPPKMLAEMGDYDFVECYITKVNAVTLQEVGDFTVGEIVHDLSVNSNFVYAKSFDGKVVITKVNDVILQKLGDYVTSRRKIVKEEKEIVDIEVEPPPEKETPKPDVCWCRACKEPYPYGEPDNIVTDGMLTCWRCATHPYLYFKGCETDEQKEKVRKLHSKQ
jgi:hypothetical protein